ncbi:357_t:CDS:2, partial [Funneliformis geosporum]
MDVKITKFTPFSSCYLMTTLPQEGSKTEVINWLRKFEEEYGYEEVAKKWLKENARALRTPAKENIKKMFGEDEGSLVMSLIYVNARSLNPLEGCDAKFVTRVRCSVDHRLIFMIDFLKDPISNYERCKGVESVAWDIMRMDHDIVQGVIDFIRIQSNITEDTLMIWNIDKTNCAFESGTRQGLLYLSGGSGIES